MKRFIVSIATPAAGHSEEFSGARAACAAFALALAGVAPGRSEGRILTGWARTAEPGTHYTARNSPHDGASYAVRIHRIR